MLTEKRMEQYVMYRASANELLDQLTDPLADLPAPDGDREVEDKQVSGLMAVVRELDNLVKLAERRLA